MLQFTKIIDAVHHALAPQYWPGAIQWADAKYNNEWSNRIDAFDQALNHAAKINDHFYAKKESEEYLSSVLRLIAEYKQTKGIDETQNFLDALDIVNI